MSSYLLANASQMRSVPSNVSNQKLCMQDAGVHRYEILTDCRNAIQHGCMGNRTGIGVHLVLNGSFWATYSRAKSPVIPSLRSYLFFNELLELFMILGSCFI